MNELRETLAEVFLAASSAVARRLLSAGSPLTVQVRRTIVERHGLSSWGVAVREEACNVLAIHRLAMHFAPWLSGDELAEVDRCAAQLAQSASATLPFWAGFGGGELPVFAAAGRIFDMPVPEYGADAGGWAARVVVLPALQWHLAALPSVDRADESAALAFANEVLGVVHDDQLRYRLVAPLSGICLDASASEQLSVPDAVLRTLSDAEQGQWVDERGGLSMALLRSGEYDPPRVALELDASGPRGAAFEPDPDPVSLLVAALQLHGHWVAGRFYVVQSNPRWLRVGLQQMPLILPGHVSGLSTLRADDMRAAAVSAKLLADYSIVQPRSPSDLALHRFLVGVARQGVDDFLPGLTHRNAADAVLDFTIALEALLLPYDKNARHGDLGYRFRVHGAHFLTDRPGERDAVARQLSGIYDMRSRLVHGGKYPSPEAVTAARDDACALARRGLLRAVHESFPTAWAFNQMVLGTGLLKPS